MTQPKSQLNPLVFLHYALEFNVHLHLLLIKDRSIFILHLDIYTHTRSLIDSLSYTPISLKNTSFARRNIYNFCECLNLLESLTILQNMRNFHVFHTHQKITKKKPSNPKILDRSFEFKIIL